MPGITTNEYPIDHTEAGTGEPMRRACAFLRRTA